jgi:spore germination protein YaaH
VRSGVRVVGLVAAAALFTTGLQGAAMGATQSPSVTATSGAPTTPAPRRLVTGWLPYWSMGSANSVVQANAALFTDVSPFWYDFRGYSPTVNLVSEYGGVASSVALYHSLKIKVLPTITDGTGGGCSYEMYNQLSTASGRAYVINTIKLLVVANNFDGIDLDWEQFAFCNGSRSWPTMRTNWIAFVKGLAAGLHTSGRLLSITVPAGNATASDSTGYYLYAWHDIGPFIDRLRIMTYDYSPSTPGPIGPYPWIDQVAAYAVTQVAAGKIQIGVASYGRDWVWSRAGSCPSLAPAGASAAQAATFFNNISWASQTHEYDSSYAATYIKTLFTNVIATTPGVSLPVAPVSTWDNTNKERTFPYQVKFTGRNQPARVTTLAVGGLMGGTSVIVGSAANVFAGAKVSGSGIGVNATVAGVVGNVVTLSVNNAGTVTGTLTFTKHTGLTGVKGAAKTNTILAPSTAGISVGSTVTGTGIGVAATVKSISGITLTLSVENTADLLPASTITFTTVAKPAAVGGVAGSTDIVVSSVAGVVLNSAVSGAGVAAGSKVTAIDAVRHNLAVSVHNTAAVTGMISITPPPVNASCTISRVGWYSEAQSAIARATLVNKYHLGGIAEWTIGGEDPAQWAGLKSYAQAIAPWPSVVTVTGQSQLTPGATGALSGSVTFRGTALAGASLLVQVKPYGSSAWSVGTSVVTDAAGHFATVVPGQRVNFSWRVTAPADGWGRIAASAVGATMVPTPASISATVPRVLLPGQAGAVAAMVRFYGVALPAVPVTLQVRRAGSATWTTVSSATTSAAGAASMALPGQSADFGWRLTVPGHAPTRLASLATGTTGVAVAAVIRASAGAIVGYLAPDSIRGTVTFKGAPVVARLTVQVRSAGSTVWRTVAYPTTSAVGAFSSSIPGQAVNFAWRVVVPTNRYTRLAALVSGVTRVRVGVSSKALHAVVASGTRPVVVGAVAPVRSGYTVVLRWWNGWSYVTQATAPGRADGTYTLTAAPVFRGVFRYVVISYPPTGQPNLPGFSKTVTVTVG